MNQDDILLYDQFLPIVKDYNNISLLQFDNYSQTKFNLFVSIDKFDFEELNKNIDLIVKILPNIKQIFTRPIIHLTEKDEILPVEAVRSISNETLQYASSHSELWANIEKGKIKPRKLLTKNYKDNYSIYENIVFTKCIDVILNYVRKNLHTLNDIVYSNRKLEIDLLEHTNHANYYLALGKLQSGYIRVFSKYSKIALSSIQRLEQINNQLTSRLHKRVYRLNKNKTKNLKLHKSNILLMDKNYSKIYRFIKKFNKESDELIITDNNINSYLYYVKFLTIFSILNFNFESNDTIDFNDIDLNFIYKTYKLNMKSYKSSILLTFNNGKEYKIALSLDDNINYNYDELIEISNIEFIDKLYLSINNINSFRRIQQVLLKGMIYSTVEFHICPFCGEKLVNENNEYFCDNCYTIIGQRNINNNTYYYTKIKSENKFIDLIHTCKDDFKRNRLIESQMYFRNITKLDSDGNCLIKEKN